MWSVVQKLIKVPVPSWASSMEAVKYKHGLLWIHLKIPALIVQPFSSMGVNNLGDVWTQHCSTQRLPNVLFVSSYFTINREAVNVILNT